METKHQKTPEEEAYWRLIGEKKEVLSDAAHEVYRQAQLAAFAANLNPSYTFQAQDYNAAMEKMRHSAADLTDPDLLARLARAAWTAAASIDPDEEDKHLTHGVYLGDMARYYLMISEMVADILEELAAELEKDTR